MFFRSTARWLKEFSSKSKSRRSPGQRRWPSRALALETLEDRTLLSINFPLNISSWTALGPAPIANGQAANQPVSGRVAGIAADPTVSGTYYLAAAGGGVWKTIDSGATWTPLTDSQQTLSMGAIAVAPSNHSVIYAGTGEANNSGDSNYGVGILKSIDGGATWTLLTDGGAFFGLTTSKIAVDPTDSNTVYAAMGNVGNNESFIPGTGIYKSTDGGATWSNTTTSINNTDSYSDVAVDPTTHTTVYMALGPYYGAAASGVYKSTNSGSTWSLLSGLTHGFGDGRISIAVAPSNSQVIYASIAGNTGNTSSGLFALERSDNGGSSWTDLTVSTPNYMGQQGWYDQAIAVNPSNSANVFVAGVVNYSTNTLAVLESTNSGASWTSIAGANVISGGNPSDPHTDHHALVFTSDGKLLDGNDGGIWRLDNATIGSIQWTNLNAGINTIQFQGVALHPTNPALALGGSQDNGTERFTDAAGWTKTDGGDGGFVKFNPQNGNQVYRVSPVGSFGTANFFRVSSNGGQTWTGATNGLNGNDEMNFYPPFAVDPVNGGRVLFGSDNLYETTNSGGLWNRIATNNSLGFNTRNAPVDAIGLVASSGPLLSEAIYVATGGDFASTSNIYATTNPLLSWSLINLPSGSGRVNDLEVDPSNSLIVYAVTSTFSASGSHHVFRTQNGGASWSDITGNLPNLPTWSLQIDTTQANTLYVGNDSGVWVTHNLGSTWSALGTGLPNAEVFQLALNTTYNTLAAATHGRGMWEILTQAITPINLTTTTANGTYGNGSVITIKIQFRANVTVTGTPTLALNSGGTATYSSGSGTNTLTFSYSVGLNDFSNRLDYSSANALVGTIKDSNGNFAALTLPAPGAAGSLRANSNIVIFTPSTITSVASTNANGTYGSGATIAITVSFLLPVTVTGTPTLALNSGGIANYTSGSGSSTLTFTYVVAAADSSTHLDYVSTTALALNGGTIKDSHGNNAPLTLPAPGAAGSLGANNNLVIFTPDTITNVTATNANGTYAAGATLALTVTFTAPVTVTGTPILTLNSGGSAAYSSGTGTSTLTFTYNVAATDYSSLLDYVSTTSLSLNGGSIKDSNGNAATLTLPVPGGSGSLSANKNIAIFTPDTVTNVSSTNANGTYGAGATVTVTVAFNRPVTVTGSPTVALNSGGTASYSSGSGSSTLSFAYTVAANDYSPLLDYVSTTSLSLNGGSIKDSNGNAATLTLVSPGSAGSLSANTNIVIFTPDTVTNVTSTNANGTYGAGAALTITVAFSRPVTVTGTPALALTSGGTASYNSGSGTSTLSFTYNVAANDYSPLLDYASTTALSGGTIKDSNGNAAALTLAAPGSAGSLSANDTIAIFTPDTVTNVTATTADGTYEAGASLTITVTFSRPVTVTGTPALGLNSGGAASYSTGSGTSTLSFSYTVAANDYSARLDYVSTASLALNGGTIEDGNGNAATLTLAAPGSAGSLGANNNLVIFTPDTVTNVTSTTADGTYGAGANLTISVTFSRSVTVTGTPALALNSGGTASYSSGSGSSTLSFTYTVAANDYSPLLDYGSSTSLSLNGGTIKDSNGNAATLTLAAPGSAGSLSASTNIVIFTPDTVTNVTSGNADGTYGAGATLTITVAFSRPVTVTGTPTLALNSGGIASYSSGSGTGTLSFTYNVAANDYSPLLDYASTTALGGGTIKDGSGNAATLTLAAPGSAGSLSANNTIAIFTPDTVTNVTSTIADGTYGTGATITITVTFSRPVTATGTPTLSLNSGATASYSTGSGTSTLSFSYLVQAGETSPRLDYSATNALSGTIKDANNNAAVLTLAAPGAAGSLGANKNIVIDAVAPVVQHYYVLFGSQSYDLIGSTRHDLPWQITGVKVVFSKPIAAADANSLTGLTTTAFSGLGTNTLTWTVSPVSLGVFATALQGSGADAIKDAVGNAITTFNQNLRILWGDVNDDGVVSIADVVAIVNASRGSYNMFADLNGDGRVDLADAQIARLLIGSKLP